jgi:uncharacterized protein (DUF983 family)
MRTLIFIVTVVGFCFACGATLWIKRRTDRTTAVVSFVVLFPVATLLLFTSFLGVYVIVAISMGATF